VKSMRAAGPALIGFLALAGICGGTAAGAPTIDSFEGQVARSAGKPCRGSVLYGVSRIRVKHAIGRVSCPTALAVSRRAVAYRVTNEFPTDFCSRGWCWSFGEFRSRGEGASIVEFRGRRGPLRIVATQQVS
jgi:hypothetical protein